MAALAGDFLGTPETPISTSSSIKSQRIDAFNTIWNSFLSKTGPHQRIAEEIPKLFDVFNREREAAEAGGPSNKAEAAFEGDQGTSIVQDFARITSNPMKAYPTPPFEKNMVSFSLDVGGG